MWISKDGKKLILIFNTHTKNNCYHHIKPKKKISIFNTINEVLFMVLLFFLWTQKPNFCPLYILHKSFNSFLSINPPPPPHPFLLKTSRTRKRGIFGDFGPQIYLKNDEKYAVFGVFN